MAFRVEENKLVYHYDAEELWIEPWGENSFRVRSTKMAQMPSEDWALLAPADCKAEIRLHEDGSASIQNGKLLAQMTPGGKLSFHREDGSLLLNEYVRNRSDVKAEYCSALDIEAREFRPLLGGDYNLSLRFESTAPDEKIYGMGQYQQPYLDLKGTDLELAHRNSQASVPFALSSLGYGFLWNNPAVGRVTFGKNITTWEAQSTKLMDYWITAGDTPAELEEAYAKATGTVPMMPDYATGFWQCKLRSTKMAQMPSEDWALLAPADCKAEIRLHEDGSASIQNGKLLAQMTPGGKLSFHREDGSLLLNEYVRNRSDVKAEYCSALDIEAREFRPLLGGDYNLSLRFESTAPDEKIYGMGQYQQPYLDLKGTDLELAHRNSQASVPFALSSLGYGFLWNNPAVGRVTFGKNITTWEAQSTKLMDYWITAGDTPAELEEAYAKATGTVPMMPDYATGFWQCKLRYQTQEELLEVAREYKRRKLPISVIVIDFFHSTFSTGRYKANGSLIQLIGRIRTL